MSAMTEMDTKYIVHPNTLIDGNGQSQAFELGDLAGKRLLIILRIDEIVEQESLQVSVWGSADGQTWGESSLFALPQKFYRGATPAALDLSQKPEVKYLQVRWETNRWGRGYPRPYFQASVGVEELR